METRWGIDSASWTEAVDQIRDILIEEARSGRLISYTKLSQQVTATPLTPDAHALHQMLGDVSREADQGGGPLLSALVVYEHDQVPGPGFFAMARALGRQFEDNKLGRLEFWQAETRRVFEQWRDKRA